MAKIILRDAILEEQYAKLFGAPQRMSRDENGSLEQPSPFQVIDSITTYGVYEAPFPG